MNSVKSSSPAWLVAALLMGLSLSACKGQDTFKRESNPIKDYESVRQNARPFDPNEKINRPDPSVNNQSACFEAFKIDIDPDNGSKLVYFTEDIQQTVVIKVRSLRDAGQPWDLKAVGEFEGQLQRLSQQGSQGTYQFSWKPARSPENEVSNKVLQLRYISQADQICGGQQLAQINLVVKKSTDAPSISLPKIETLPFGKSMKIEARINDVNASSKTAPELEVKFIEGARGGEHALLNAKPAVQITGKEFRNGAWIFTLLFDSRLIADDELKPFLGSGQTVDSRFYLKTKSRFGVASPDHPVNIAIQFEKIEKPGTPAASTDTQFTAPPEETKPAAPAPAKPSAAPAPKKTAAKPAPGAKT